MKDKKFYAEKFIRFLKFNRCYTRFCTLYALCSWHQVPLKERLENTNPKWYVDSFNWDLDASFGYNYIRFWSKVDEKWKALLENEEKRED